MTKIKTHKFFPVPIFEFKIQNHEVLNEKLEEYIYKLQEIDPKGMKLSNSGGWHSPYFKIGESELLKDFVKIIQKYLSEIITIDFGWAFRNDKVMIEAMWSVINKKNSFNVRHSHPNCMLSAAYYVKAPKNCGKFQVESLNTAKRYWYPEIKNKNELNMDVVGIFIEEGDLLIFPGYLPHKVSKNESDEDRIVISFNVDIR